MKKNKGHDQYADAGDTDQQAAQQASPPVPADQPDGELAIDVAAETSKLREELDTKEKDFEALSDKYLRLAAEYDNFRRRTQKEKESLYSDSIAIVIKELLPVFDNLERAELAAGQYSHDDAKKIAEGITMIQKQVEQALEKLSVRRINCIGQPFNPVLHEAVMHVEDDSVGNSIVVAELQAGYQRDDRVIRHSMVKVAN